MARRTSQKAAAPTDAAAQPAEPAADASPGAEARLKTELAQELAEKGRHAPITVRDAASLILYDTKGPSVLMGRRSMKHVFMPGRFVFPGGRVDPTDARVRLHKNYHEITRKKLVASTRAGVGEARARGLGAAAVRETYEETGVLVGASGATPTPTGPAWTAFAERDIALDFSVMRYVLRAVTPPGRPRRFDTRFFAVHRDAIAQIDPARVGEDAELEEIAWVTLKEARQLELPAITHIVLDELDARLKEDPALAPELGVPYYRFRNGKRSRVVL